MQMSVSHHLDLLLRFNRGLMLKESVRAAVREGDTVLDAGCGTGILSVWAVQAGARRVVSVDTGDLRLAKAVAHANGCQDTIEFIQANLDEMRWEEGQSFDVMMAMVFYNDPRRDEAQSALIGRLRQRVLRPGGRVIPDRVRYGAYAVQWEGQDIGARFEDIDRKVDILEARYGLVLRPVGEAAKSSPNPAWFPVRKESGILDRPEACLLSEQSLFASLTEETLYTGYPPMVRFRIIRPGVFNVVLFVQDLFFQDRLLFSNESISWMRSPVSCVPGDEIDLDVEGVWRDTNIFSSFRMSQA
jgi:SAM-dependent methyltransferase